MIKKIALKLKNKMMLAVGAVAMALAVPTVVGAAPLDLSGAGLQVDPADAVATGKSFAGGYSPWVLLIVGLLLVPTLVGFVIYLAKRAPKFGGGKN